MLAELRQRLQALQSPAGIEDNPGPLALGVEPIDLALGGGLARGALHEIAAASEAHLAAATGFALGMVSRAHPVIPGQPHEPEGRMRTSPESMTPAAAHGFRARPFGPSRNDAVLWIAEDMALAESGVPYGPGLDAFGLAPERLAIVSVAYKRDLLWAMEESMRCRAVSAVIGELRHDAIDMVAVRRLSLAAAESGALALLLRVAPPSDASTAATRWIVGASSPSPGALSRADLPPPGGGERNARFAVRLIRNRRGPVGSWIIEWSDGDECFALATHAQPVAAPALDRPHRKIA